MSARCPKCGHPSDVPSGITLRAMWCSTCRLEFEEDDHDGLVGYGDPAGIVERQEERRLAERERARRQRR
jgi:hypothetical protein